MIKKIIICIFVTLILYTSIILFTPVGIYIGNKNKEIKYITKIRKNPKDDSAYKQLLSLYYSEVDFEKVLEVYKQRSKNISDHSSETYAHIADIYMILSGLKERKAMYADSAKKYADLAYKVNDHSHFTLRLIAEVYKKLEEDSLAYELYQRILSKYHGDSIMLYAGDDKQQILKEIEDLQKNEKQNN